MQKLLFFSAFLVLSFPAFSQSGAKVFTGPGGIFVYCGDSLPKNFYYEVSRADARGSTGTPAILDFPSGYDEFKAKLLTGFHGGLPFSLPAESTLLETWKLLGQGATNLALGDFKTNTAFLYAAGCGYWDGSVVKNETYSFRIKTIDKKTKLYREILNSRQSFIPKEANIQLKLKEVQIETGEITLDVLLEKHDLMEACRVFRSQYLLNDFREIFPVITYVNAGKEKHLRIHDAGISDKAQYTYRLIPYDHFGNPGKALENIDVYNVTKHSLQGGISRLRAESVAEQNAIRLEWKVVNPAGIIAVDIYRSTDYDGAYLRLASLSPDQDSWLDYKVKTMQTYFYSIVVQTAYARSYPSARTSGLLVAKRANLLPPQGVKAVKAGNHVNISWLPSNDDTRAYYVYRAFSYQDEPKLLAGPLVSNEPLVQFTDSLADVLQTEAVYVYAIRDENTSSLLSPLSEKVAVHARVTRLPEAIPMDTRYAGGRLHLMWPDFFGTWKGLDGFNVYRQCLDMEDQVREDWILLKGSPTAFGVNAFTDAATTEGYRYRYALEAIGVDGSRGSRSPWVAVYIPENLPQAPANIRAYASPGQIRVEWDPVLDNNIAKILVYRADENTPSRLIAEPPLAQGYYIDRQTVAGMNYYYYVVTEDSSGRKCKEAAAIGIAAREN